MASLDAGADPHGRYEALSREALRAWSAIGLWVAPRSGDLGHLVFACSLLALAVSMLIDVSELVLAGGRSRAPLAEFVREHGLEIARVALDAVLALAPAAAGASIAFAWYRWSRSGQAPK